MSNATNSQNLVIVGPPEHGQNDLGQDPVHARCSLLIPVLRHAQRGIRQRFSTQILTSIDKKTRLKTLDWHTLQAPYNIIIIVAGVRA